jgi:hypothetical protein
MPFANQPTITDAAAACDTIDMSRAAKAWATFTELVHDLDACQSGTGQIEATLDALRATLGKGIVYWFNEASGELIGPGAPAPLSAEGCRSFAQKMVTRK